jgi:hypothetical protein
MRNHPKFTGYIDLTPLIGRAVIGKSFKNKEIGDGELR